MVYLKNPIEIPEGIPKSILRATPKRMREGEVPRGREILERIPEEISMGGFNQEI